MQSGHHYIARPCKHVVKRVFVNGYGSIGSRIASFLQDDPHTHVVGVGKYSPDAAVQKAISQGLDVYVPQSRIEKFGGAASGTIETALDAADMVIDASPGGMGFHNKRELYGPRDIPVIYQGGESAFGDKAVSDFIFNSRVNYEQAVGRQNAIQGSCNVTGMGRIIAPLQDRYEGDISRIDITLVRRWADIEQTDKTVPDTIQTTPNPHHANDAKSYLGNETSLYVRAIKVPTRQMHLHIMDIRFSGTAPDPAEIHAAYGSESGVAVLQCADGTKEVREFANSMKYSFQDTNMVHIHANMTASRGDTVQLIYSDDQTGIVIPENHMLMQAMLHGTPYMQAVAHTESVFHMDERKAMLERHFACNKQ